MSHEGLVGRAAPRCVMLSPSRPSASWAGGRFGLTKAPNTTVIPSSDTPCRTFAPCFVGWPGNSSDAGSARRVTRLPRPKLSLTPPQSTISILPITSQNHCHRYTYTHLFHRTPISIATQNSRRHIGTSGAILIWGARSAPQIPATTAGFARYVVRWSPVLTISRLSRWSINYYNDTANQAAQAGDGSPGRRRRAGGVLLRKRHPGPDVGGGRRPARRGRADRPRRCARSTGVWLTPRWRSAGSMTGSPPTGRPGGRSPRAIGARFRSDVRRAQECVAAAGVDRRRRREGDRRGASAGRSTRR